MEQQEQAQILAAIDRQLAALDTSEYFLRYGMLSSLLRWWMLRRQREALLQSLVSEQPADELMELVPIELLTSLLALFSLCGYFSQTAALYQTLTPGTAQFSSVQQDLLLNAISILTMLVRYCKLLDQKLAPDDALTPNEEALELAP